MAGEPVKGCRELADELRAMGVRRGLDLLVHSSLRRIGPVSDGAATVLQALRNTVGPDAATIVVPTQTTANSLTSKAFLNATARLDTAELASYVAAMPGFDPGTTPSSGMGGLAEYVRTSPGAVRSAHPQASFAALGPRAADCMASHDMACHLGEQSPLGWLYEHGAAVLLFGVTYAACTAFHLAEYRLPEPPPLRTYQCFTATEGGRAQHAFTEIALDDSDFEELGGVMDKEPFVRRGKVGAAECRLFPIRAAVDFALAWPPFAQRRAAS